MKTVDIPIMRGNEATYVTINVTDSATDEDVYRRVLMAGSYMTIGTEIVQIRMHLLTPRSRYPTPPAWDGWTDHQVIVADEFAARVAASQNGLSIWVTDEYGYEPGDEPDATIPWTDVIAAAQKIGVKV